MRLDERASCCVQNLDDDGVALLLLMVHQRLLTAHNANHRHAALVPFQALLELLESRVLVPATFRYATQILVQLLHFRYSGATCKVALHLLTAVSRSISA